MARLARSLDPLYRLYCRLRSRADAPRGVLLVSAGGLGDTVLFSLVAGRFARLALPDETVTALLRKDGAKTGFCLPAEMQVETVDFGRFDRSPGYRWQVMERLWKANYRLVVSTDFLRHPYLDEAIIAATQAPEKAAMKARPWAKYDRALENASGAYARLFDSGPARKDKVMRWSEFANFLGGTAEAPPKVRLHRSFEAAMPGNEVIIQPFSAVKAKQVDVALYQAILDALPGDVQVSLTGLPQDLDANPELRPLLDRANVRFDSATFAELAPRLAAARLVISVDTALMHLAVALGAPTLCLASAAYVGEIVPYDPAITPGNVTFLYESMPCEGCLGDCIHPLRKGRYPCIDALTPERAADATLARIQSPNSA
jgi:ADP-heptose:LPS heptosyltransferase